MTLEDVIARVPSIIDDAIVEAMRAGMSYADAQEIRWAVANARTVAWGADAFAGARCPLKLAGFNRVRVHGPWDVPGGGVFESAYDRAMNRCVLHGPGMVGLPR